MRSVCHRLFAKVNLGCEDVGMPTFPDTSLLMPAIDVARKVLSDLEVADTPAALRKIKASSARRLPPPLIKSLLAGLDRDTQFREKVLQAQDWDVAASDPAFMAASLYVVRPEGWSSELDHLVTVHLAAAQEADRKASAEKIRSLEADLVVARQKTKTVRSNADKVVKELTAQLRQAKAERSASSGATDRETGHLRARIKELTRHIDEARAEVTASAIREKRLRADIRRTRQTNVSAVETPRKVWGSRDAIEMARLVDHLAISARPDPVAEPKPQPDSPRAFALPPGIAPDTPAAVDWLLNREAATTLVVDGYNVTFLVDGPSFSSSQARQDLITRLGLLKRSAKGPLRIVAVFDSQYGLVVPVLGSTVEVSFVESADDEVRRLARDTNGSVVVVSTDREVQDGSREAGAIVLWSEAFARWW